jgi:hypothetical protein
MAIDVYQGTTKIGLVSTSGEVFFGGRKVGWVNGNGDIYRDGIPFGWITHAGTILDRRSKDVGRVDSSGAVYRGENVVGRVDDATNRYYTGGAALLLLGRYVDLPPTR